MRFYFACEESLKLRFLFRLGLEIAGHFPSTTSICRPFPPIATRVIGLIEDEGFSRQKLVGWASSPSPDCASAEEPPIDFRAAALLSGRVLGCCEAAFAEFRWVHK